jgi:hypothetical protein
MVEVIPGLFHAPLLRVYYLRGQLTFSVNGPIVNILGFMGMWFIHHKLF